MPAEQIDQFMQAISGLESGGNPDAQNERTRAHGLFQIMPQNWSPWAREAGLSPNAPKTPENQRHVTRHKMLQYYRQYGTWDAVAVAWFAGPGAANRYLKGDRGVLQRSDGNLTVREYVDRIMGTFNAQRAGAGNARPQPGAAPSAAPTADPIPQAEPGLFDEPQQEDTMERVWTRALASISDTIRQGADSSAVMDPGGKATPLPDQPAQPAEVQAASQGDPISVQGAGGRPASGVDNWSQYENGRIPEEAMAEVEPGHRLKPDAAEAYQRMKADAAAQGVTLKLTDSYRSFEEQVSVRKRKGDKVATAKPGTSKHGLAIAIDVAGDAARKWIQQNGHKYGWTWPAWAQKKGTKNYEPWHFEFMGGA